MARRKKKKIVAPQRFPPHIPRLAFAYIDSIQFGVRPVLQDGESWNDEVDPMTGDLVIKDNVWREFVRRAYEYS